MVGCWLCVINLEWYDVGFYSGYDHMTSPCGRYGLDMFGTGKSNVPVVKGVWFLLWITSGGFDN